ncbi:MAG TPA: 50S ribosomal protein L6 [Gammaproteobacteria bacterium]|nr:50S ribosomal protein L6 [Gammaproteobacteria bacterium]
MSRVANEPVTIPKGVEVTLSGRHVAVKGPQGAMELDLNAMVTARQDDEALRFSAPGQDRKAVAMAGTMRSLVANMVHGVTQGFERRLQLVGVGYRAQLQGKNLNLSLGMSHPVYYPVPEGITIEVPSQTEIVVKGVDKQQVGQVAAEIRSLRPPEPYKGKGVRYADERVVLKEAKKK